MSENVRPPIRQVDAFKWELPQDYKAGMLAPGLVFATESLMEQIASDNSLDQVANVACLPGIVKASMAMPDIHWGYGFPVGGVAATSVDDGVVSPGGVGFDINCGVRMLRTDLLESDVRPRIDQLVDALFTNVPSGLGSSGKVRLQGGDIDRVLSEGARWAVDKGYGVPEDLDLSEAGGRLPGADPDRVSARAKRRGAPQLGTLGSGNHFLEVQIVDEIFDPEAARVMGVEDVGQVLVMMHCGSRGLGHQICDDYLKVMDAAIKSYGIELPDRQLACCPVESPEGRDYIAAMYAGANFAWANRQCIAHWVRESFAQVFGGSWESLGIRQVYDVCHNIAKIEEHNVDGRSARLCVHRKGAIRAFPPGHPDIPARYQATGQPVLIPGDMGRYSFLAVGGPAALEESFGSTCHGAGRAASRSAAKRILKGRDIQGEMASQGIAVRAHGWDSLAEEASIAYKDVADVIEACEQAGLSRKVARMRPLGVVKG